MGVSCIPLTPNEPGLVVKKRVFPQPSNRVWISLGSRISAEASFFYKFVLQSTKWAAPRQENITYSAEKNEPSQRVWALTDAYSQHW